jgi:hypothetical protein
MPKAKERECPWNFTFEGAHGEAACGLVFNHEHNAVDMLNPEYTGKGQVMKYCYHCGGKIVPGKRIVVKGKLKIIKDHVIPSHSPQVAPKDI